MDLAVSRSGPNDALSAEDASSSGDDDDLGDSCDDRRSADPLSYHAADAHASRRGGFSSSSKGRSNGAYNMGQLSRPSPPIPRLCRSISTNGYRKIWHRAEADPLGTAALLGLEADGGAVGGRARHGGGGYLGFAREMLLSSWLNSLLIFVPIGLAAFLADMSPIFIFVSNALAVIPLSSLLTAATEQVASDAGETVGALLNISLGNLVELILFIALIHHQIRVVQASILGSILVNLLLILGTALLVTGRRSDQDPTYDIAETQLLSCLLFVSVFVFLMPTTFAYTFVRAKHATLEMSRISAIMVLLIYVLYFVHELKKRGRHAGDAAFDMEGGPDTVPAAEYQAARGGPRALSARTVRFADEDGTNTANVPRGSAGGNKPTAAPPIIELSNMDGASGPAEDGADHRGRPSQELGASGRTRFGVYAHSRSLSQGSVGRGRASSTSNAATAGLMMGPGLRVAQIVMQNSSSRTSLDTLIAGGGGGGGSGPGSTTSELQLAPTPRRNRSTADRVASVLTLVIASALMSMSAEFLVGTIDAVTHQGHLSESLIGLIILPIVGNIAEYVTVVTVASKDKLDLAIAVSVGSSIQIALCVTPLTVLAGWASTAALSLTFSFFEMATLVGSALLVSLLVLNDGSNILRTCSLKGALMCACYAIIGFGAYLSPELK